MKTTSRNPRFPLGFSRTELLVVIAVLGILISLIVVNLRPAKAIRSAINCRNKLMQIGVAFRGFTDDHGGKLPMAVSTNQGGTLEFAELPNSAYHHFQVLSNLLGPPYYLVCPQDTRKAATNWGNLANTNVSYFVGLNSDLHLPVSILAGDRNITPVAGVVLKTDQASPPSWVASVGLHGNRGHLLFGDGHVEELSSLGLSNAVSRTGIATNRFAVP